MTVIETQLALMVPGLIYDLMSVIGKDGAHVIMFGTVCSSLSYIMSAMCTQVRNSALCRNREATSK